MSDVIQNETLFFLTSVATGILLVFAYDLLRILRRVFRHGIILTGAEDFFYWSMSAFVIFCMIYETNNGAIRWFAIVGIVLGVLLYHESVSSYIVKGVSFVLNVILHWISGVFDIFCRPFRLLKKSFKKLREKRLKFAGKDCKMEKEKPVRIRKKGKIGKDDEDGQKKAGSGK